MDETGPLTREAVTAEVGKAMSDPAHPKHASYTQNLSGYGEWVNSLYQRIPVEGQADATPHAPRALTTQVTIGDDGLTIGGPEAEATAQLAQDIQAVNKSLAQHWGADTEARVSAAKQFLMSFPESDQKLMQQMADRLGDDVLALRVVDSILRKGRP
jgi:hypothetical protein